MELDSVSVCEMSGSRLERRAAPFYNLVPECCVHWRCLQGEICEANQAQRNFEKVFVSSIRHILCLARRKESSEVCHRIERIERVSRS
jgi:hypothetical protein